MEVMDASGLRSLRESSDVAVIVINMIGHRIRRRRRNFIQQYITS